MAKWNMPADFADVCVEALKQAAAPLAARQLRMGLAGPYRFPPAKAPEVEPLLAELASGGRIYGWPPRGGRARYWGRGIGDAAREALIDWLDASPGMLKQAAKAIRPRLPGLAARQVELELESLLYGMAQSGEAVEVTLSRTAKVWIGRSWMARQAKAPRVDSLLSEAILASVDAMAPGRGAMAPVCMVRQSQQLRQAFDQAAMALAREGKLVLGEYAGPRPLPEEELPGYVEGANLRYYVGLARPGGGNDA